MPDLVIALIGAGVLAAIQLAGAVLYTWASPHDARDVWESYAVVNGWWFLAPLSVLRDARWHWRQRHLRTPQGGPGALLARIAIRIARGRNHA